MPFNDDLIEAVRQNNCDRATYLLAMGASPNATKNDDTALDIAVENNNKEMVSILVDEDEIYQSSIQNSLLTAMSENKKEISTILSRSLKIPQTPEIFDKPYIVMAIEKNWDEVVKNLIKNGALLSRDENKGYRLLHFAIHKRRYPCLSVLTQHMDVNDINGGTLPPLHFAALRGDARAVDILLKAKANPNIKIKNPPDIKTEVINVIFPIIGPLLTHNKEQPSNRAIHYAAKADSKETIKTLYNHNPSIDLNEIGINGKSPLLIASEDENLRSCFQLLHLGADPDFTKNGTTPLMVAAQKGNKHLAIMLLKYGADPRKVNNNGQTALQISRAFKHDKTTQVLEQAMLPQKLFSKKPFKNNNNKNKDGKGPRED